MSIARTLRYWVHHIHAVCSAFQHMLAFDEELVDWHRHVGAEVTRVEREMKQEASRFASEWTKYTATLQREVLKSKLPQEWIPQMDQVDGTQYYLHLHTGKTIKEHPNKALFQQLLSKQRVCAEEQYSTQQRRLEAYLEHLHHQQEQHRQQTLKRMTDAMRLLMDTETSLKGRGG